MNRNEPAYLDPARGDVIKRDGKFYRVTGRGVADSVGFVRTTAGGAGMQGQKSLPCWRRLIEAGEIVSHGAR